MDSGHSCASLWCISAVGSIDSLCVCGSQADFIHLL